VFIGSGIRHDLVLKDERFGRKYLETVVQHHVSGQLKLAPEHTEGDILKLMAKPDIDGLLQFKEEFDLLSQASGKKQFLTYYFIAAYPGCTEGHMIRLRDFVHRHLKINPEQVQIFTPSPATVATLMYYTERDFETGRSLFVEKERSGKERQKRILVPENGGR